MTETENSVSADENQVEKYRDSDLANNGIVGKFFKEDNGTTKEGVTVNILNPSSTVEDKKKFGIQIDIDRKSSERTYNGVYVTDSQRGVPIRRGSQGELVKPGEDPDFDGVNYPTSEEEAAKIDHNVNVGNQVTINIYTSEEFLKDLNSVDNKRTNFAWKHNYVRDNPTKKAFDGGNFEAGFSVNPYPNENKDLSIIRVVGDTNIEKVPVKGQYIKTGARIENLGEEDYTRVTSEVYHPDGTLVDPKEARAILVSPDNIEEMKDHVGEVSLGDIIFKMPKGALEDPNSIFNNNKFNAIQNLRAEFFARPRTEAEFKKIVENVNKAQGYTDKYYVGTGAGTNTIKHNGEDITIDKQGIARYDHYNTLGTITVNLDDTLYYDQTFDRKLKNKTDKVTSIEPGETKEISIDDAKTKENLGSKPNGKTQDQMNEAEAEGRARGTIDPDFVARAEKQGWKIDRTNVDPNNPDSKIDISKFKITPPADAAPGDFIAIPITYTYTNGSTDIEWFHFVVQDTYTNKPEYHAKFGYQGDKLVSNPTLPSTQSDLKKAQPENYELVGGPTYTDDKGNTWTDVKVDQNTGVVTATVPQDTNIQGGEELFVPVKVTYTDKNTNDTITETVKAQFIARTPEVDNAVVVNEVETEIPFKSKEVFDDTIAMGTIVVESEGTPGTGKVQFKQNVVNGQKGLIDENGTFIPGVDKFFIDKTTVTEPVDRLVKVGVKPVKETVTIPRTVEVEVDPNMEPTAEPVVVEEGNDGLVTVKTKKNPQTGVIEIEKSTTKQANPKKVKVGTKTSGIIVDNDEIPFEYKITKDPNLKKGEYVIDVEGKPGSNTKTWTIENSKVIGDPKVENVDPINAVIRVGDQDFTGTISHDVTEEIPFEVKVIEDDNLEAGKYIVEQEGQKGSKTSTFTQDIKNGQAYGELKTEENITKEPTKHIIRVGKKPATNSVDIDKNIPVDIIYKFDPDKDVTIAEKGDFTPGTVKTVVNNKYNPETGQIESEEKTVITPAKQEIIVGTKKYTGEFTNEFTEEIPFETEIIIDDSLEAGEKRVENPGKLGSKTTKVTQNFVNGKQVSINKEEINKTDPEKRVIKVGSKTNGEHSHIEKIPFKYDVQYDENLQAGQYKIEVEGKPGERKTTWNIVNSKIDGSPIVSETPAVDAIIKVGNKDFTGSFETVDKDPIPFETEYRIDNTLEQGKEVLVQEGILGENSTRTIHIIVNGQVTQSNEGETNQTKAPKKKIVKIGAKTDGEHKVTEEIPFKIEVKKDPTLKKGEWKYEQDENGEDKTGVVGSQEKTLTIENSEVTNISDLTVTKQAQNAVILV